MCSVLAHLRACGLAPPRFAVRLRVARLRKSGQECLSNDPIAPSSPRARCLFADIVKRRVVRNLLKRAGRSRVTLVFPAMHVRSTAWLSPQSAVQGAAGGSAAFHEARALTQCRSFSSRDARSGRGRALVMRAIKCLKGVRWMPGHAQAMKDVVRCEKPWGAANKL